ncbi:MAG TPA: nicotinate-nucleotide adenylyltransferase [Alphaproteobacteria bacterium]|nr:nicotinate-nucleotide adenylyltransferase [Alphaproteobacteria bacterium]
MMLPHLHSGPSYAGLSIGLLGGSFNPAHAGHLAISRYAQKRLGLDQVWWLVSPQNPLKPEKGMAPFSARLAAARQLAAGKITVTDLETQFGTRYTADTLRQLRRRFPRTKFIWLMGADNLLQIPRWRRWPGIFRHTPVAVFRRPGARAGYNIGKAAQRFAKAAHPGHAKKLAFLPPPAWLVLGNPLHVASATALRAQRRGRGKGKR